MTDNDIIKALEKEIRLAEYVDSDYCSSVDVSLLRVTIDLINRQQAEIERLKASFENLQKTTLYWYEKCNELLDECEIAKSEARKEFAERLKEKYRMDFNSTWSSIYNPIDNLLGEMEKET